MMKLRTLLAAALVALPAIGWAHSASVGPNGGPQIDVGNLHVEYTAQDRTMTFHVRDHGDKPVKTDGYKGTAIFVIDGKPLRIPLLPGGDNRLVGTTPAAAPAKPRGAVQIQSPAGASIQGRFN
jgi:hypothetical protein